MKRAILKSLTGMIGLMILTFTTACNPVSSNKTNSDSQQSNTIAGDWYMTNAPENAVGEFKFNADGSFEMTAISDKTDFKSNREEIKGSWTQNGNKVYLSKPGETNIAIMEIYSLDQNSMVFHFNGEPENEIVYLKRK